MGQAFITLEEFIEQLDNATGDHLKYLRSDVLSKFDAKVATDAEISGSFNGGKRYADGCHCLYLAVDENSETYLISTPLGPITISIDFNRKNAAKQKVSVRAYDRSICEIIMEVRDSEEMDRGGIQNISQLKEVLEICLERR